ncbi:MAG: ATP-binding cassette domain-containing protein, partial [Alphaproteobacteria bacterium]
MDILSLNNISQEFFLPRKLTDIVTNRPARSIRAVQSMNLAIHENEILGIAGESGCGKSTTCMIAAGLLAPTDGDVLHRGQALTAMDEQTKKTFRRSVQIIFQYPYESLNPRFEIGDTVAEGPRA